MFIQKCSTLRGRGGEEENHREKRIGIKDVFRYDRGGGEGKESTSENRLKIRWRNICREVLASPRLKSMEKSENKSLLQHPIGKGSSKRDTWGAYALCLRIMLTETNKGELRMNVITNIRVNVTTTDSTSLRLITLAVPTVFSRFLRRLCKNFSFTCLPRSFWRCARNVVTEQRHAAARNTLVVEVLAEQSCTAETRESRGVARERATPSPRRGHRAEQRGMQHPAALAK